MKKVFVFLFSIALVVIFSVMSCGGDFRPDYELTPQEFWNKEMKHSKITDSTGHTLILHEYGLRGNRDYSFSVEHSPECRKCCEIYD